MSAKAIRYHVLRNVIAYTESYSRNVSATFVHDQVDANHLKAAVLHDLLADGHLAYDGSGYIVTTAGRRWAIKTDRSFDAGAPVCESILVQRQGLEEFVKAAHVLADTVLGVHANSKGTDTVLSPSKCVTLIDQATSVITTGIDFRDLVNGRVP